MKHTIKILALSLLSNHSQAQYRDRLQFNAGNFVVAGKEPLNMFVYTFVRQMGISYAHAINDKLSIQASYMLWFDIRSIGRSFKYDGYFEPIKQYRDIRLGDIESRQSYQSIDLKASYSIIQRKQHQIYGGAGISYTSGWYTYYTGIYNHPGYPDWLFDVKIRKHQDWGLAAEVGYNYMLAHQRINLGISETVRTYTTLPFQFYTNINIGYNFNWQSSQSKRAGKKK